MHLKSPVHVVPQLSNNDGDGETNMWFNNALPAQIHTNILKPSKIIGKTIDPRYLTCFHRPHASTVQYYINTERYFYLLKSARNPNIHIS